MAGKELDMNWFGEASKWKQVLVTVVPFFSLCVSKKYGLIHEENIFGKFHVIVCSFLLLFMTEVLFCP